MKCVHNERLKNFKLKESSQSYSVLWFSIEVVIKQIILNTKLRNTLIIKIDNAKNTIAMLNTLLYTGISSFGKSPLLLSISNSTWNL